MEDSSIHCLKQSQIVADAACRISQLTAEILAAPEMLAAPDGNDDDPLLTSYDDEDELRPALEDTD